MTAGGSEPDAPGSVAASASQRVHAILEAAEASAAEIRREAQEEAATIRERARADAGRASASIEATVRRLEALHGELGGLIASLRSGEAASEAAPAPAPVSGPAPEAASVSRPAPEAASVSGPAPEPAPAPASPTAADPDAAGVRLIALNMALDGTPREQAARFLAENFSLADPEQLLDEVYASVQR
jgi:hypothetical protein